MRARTIILTVTAAIVIGVPGALVAQAPPGDCDGQGPNGGAWHHGAHGGGPGGGLGIFDRMMPRLAERIGLTDEQLADIRTILDEAQPRIEALSDQLRAGRQAYHEAHPDPTIFDEGAFRIHAAEQSSIQVDLMALIQSTRASALSVLTPEQLEQLEELRGTMGNHHKRRAGGRRSS